MKSGKVMVKLVKVEKPKAFVFKLKAFHFNYNRVSRAGERVPDTTARQLARQSGEFKSLAENEPSRFLEKLGREYKEIVWI